MEGKSPPGRTETTLNDLTPVDSEDQNLGVGTSTSGDPERGVGDTSRKANKRRRTSVNHDNSKRNKTLERQPDQSVLDSLKKLDETKIRQPDQSVLDFLKKLDETKILTHDGYLKGCDYHSVLQDKPLSELVMRTLLGGLKRTMSENIFPDIGINICGVTTSTNISIDSSQRFILVRLEKEEESFEHWCLIEVNFKDRWWSFYDPLIGHDNPNNEEHVAYMEGLMQPISEDAKPDPMMCKTGKEDTAIRKLGKLRLIKDFPTQSHADDCGVLVWLRAKFQTKTEEYTPFNPIKGEKIDSKKERENLAHDLYDIDVARSKQH